MMYEYPGGVSAEERPLVEQFERDVLPYTQRNGPMIGAAAMNGNKVAEEIIVRQRLFVEGLPTMRNFNLKLLVKAIKLWEATR